MIAASPAVMVPATTSNPVQADPTQADLQLQLVAVASPLSFGLRCIYTQSAQSAVDRRDPVRRC